jgi:hypothetical protein
MSQIPAWLEITQSVMTTVGVLGALYVAVWREPRKARVERAERAAEMAALQRAEDDRIAAQARKVVPAVYRADLFGENIWTVRINNLSSGVVSNLAVRVVAIEQGGGEVPNGCAQANNQISVGKGMERIVSDALSGALSGAFQSNPMLGRMGTDQIRRLVDQRLGTEVSERMREVMLGQLVREWMTTLTPGQFAVMAFKTTNSTYTLRVTIEYEDEAGYRWQRTDSSQPSRLHVGA